MLVAYWIVAGLLALAYLFAGGSKLLQSKAKLAGQQGWANDFSAGTVKVIGIVEVLGAIGLILPPLTGLAPLPAPLAAVGLVIVQIVAIIVHIRRGEQKQLAPNLVLLALGIAAAVLGWVSSRKRPRPRGGNRQETHINIVRPRII